MSQLESLILWEIQLKNENQTYVCPNFLPLEFKVFFFLNKFIFKFVLKISYSGMFYIFSKYLYFMFYILESRHFLGLF